MNPMMKGSAAFLGLQCFSFAEFLDGDALRNVLLDRAARRPKSERSIEGKDSADQWRRQGWLRYAYVSMIAVRPLAADNCCVRA
jgi:hypothetical protein